MRFYLKLNCFLFMKHKNTEFSRFTGYAVDCFTYFTVYYDICLYKYLFFNNSCYI